ncbi:MAG: cobalamin biosynthesis protein CobD [Chloracidobacterium sp. CP2_5A]|nr:MAG: cobalamin biosynthesis protein CobD [Chloracidobacterium sp. CP2_5A]
MSPLLLAAAYALDRLIGDPPRLPHPVRWMGAAIAAGERLLRPLARGPATTFLVGAALTLALVGLSYGGSLLALRELCRWSPAGGAMVATYLAATTLATRDLLDETASVVSRLLAGDLPGARRRVARIVGRDTDALSESEVCRAAVETLAESASDGIIAPLFYLAVGGVPAALAYKAVNTLDSCIGHADERYFWFGKFAARLDDIANLIPARLTAALVVVAAWLSGDDWRGALRVWFRDAHRHASPNAGRPEAALAGALGVRLGGVNHYGGVPATTAFLGDARRPLDIAAVEAARRLVSSVSWLGFAAALAFCLWSVQ